MRKLQHYEVPHDDVKLIDTLRDYKLVYVATPFSKYSDGLAAAYEDACQVVGDLLRYNINAFSPIVHSYGISEHANIDPLDHKFWMRVDKPYMEKCDALIVMQLDGWDESVGIGMEIKAFREAGKPIHFIKPVKAMGALETSVHKLGPLLIVGAFTTLLAIVLFAR